MATWKAENSMLTKIGIEILNKIKLGDSGLTISRIVAGSGRVSESHLYNQTQVLGTVKELTIYNKKVLEEGTEISFYITNEGNTFTEPYEIHQLGIYVTHPDYSGEQLYFITQCNEDDFDTIPVSGETPVRLDYSILLEHSNSDSITVNIDPLGAASREDLENFKQENSAEHESITDTIYAVQQIVSGVSNRVDTLEQDYNAHKTSTSNSISGLRDSLNVLNSSFINFREGLSPKTLITSDDLGNLIASGKTTVKGNTFSVTDAITHRALSLSIEGKSTQATAPTISTPVYLSDTKVTSIHNADGGSNSKLISFPSAIVLRSLGDYKDTIEWDGAKWWKVQRIAEVTVDGTTVSFGRPAHSNSANYSRGTIYTLDSDNKVKTFTDALPSSPVLTSHGNDSFPSTSAKFYGFLESVSGTSQTRVQLHILHTAIGLQAGQKEATARLNEIVSWIASQNSAGTPVKVWYVLNTPIVTEISLTEVLEMYASSTSITCNAEGSTPDMVLSYALNTTDDTTMYILRSLTRKSEVPTANTFAEATLV